MSEILSEIFCMKQPTENFAGTHFACARPKGHKGKHKTCPLWQMNGWLRDLSKLGFKLVKKEAA